MSPPQAAPEPPDTDYSVVSRDAHNNVYQRTTYELTPSGQWYPHVHQYVETATGLNFQDSTGAWQPSSPDIEPVPGGAAATNGQHKVIFAADLATTGAINLQMPNGQQQLQSDLIGLRYLDQSSGQSAFIATVTNSIGEIVGTNQVWYGNAFVGLKGSVHYIYTISGFEQDIVLEQCPAPPETYGLNSATTVLQAITEFLSPPAAAISTNSIAFSSAGAMSDVTIDFPLMRIGRGRAFLIGDSDTAGVPVSKQWTNWDGHQVLIEQIPLTQIAAELQTLPYAQSASRKASKVRVASLKRTLPARPTARKDARPMKFASLSARKAGFLLDYTTINTSQTNMVWRGDMDYYLSGNVDLYGTNTVFEGGTILKYASNATLTVDTPVTWQGVPYRPVLMTSKDDNSAGESLPGSTGNPGNNHYATTALFYDGSVTGGANLTITNLRVLNAQTAVAINSSWGHVLTDVQLINCGNGIAVTNTDLALHNALFYLVQTNFTGSNDSVYVEQLTSDTADWVNEDTDTNVFLTNCLLTDVVNLGGCGMGSVVVTNSSGVFQTGLPGGLHYLADDSPYRNAGTTNITAATLADLQQKTTYPPIVYTNTVISIPTTFSPQAQRDNDIPDLGYHYDPLDYVFGGVISNANLTFTAGTAVGWYRTTSGFRSGVNAPMTGIGINMANGAVASFQGTATAPDYWVRCNTVQEQDNSGGSGPGGLTGSDDQYDTNISLSPLLLMNFTKCTEMTFDGGGIFRDDYGYLVVQAKNSEFDSGNVAGYVISCYFTNCLWDREVGGQVQGWPGDEWIARNCTFHGGKLVMERVTTYASIPVRVRDCSFDGTAFNLADSLSSNTNYTDYNYNAYTNATDPFPIGGSNDKPSTTFDWEDGPLGNYYLPTNSPLLGAGDVPASQVGLYHFTITTNEVPEGTNIVSIGYHYVALSNGVPLDSNGDGIPDYLEDINGNGQVQSGEINWTNASDLGLNVLITRPKNNSLIP